MTIQEVNVKDITPYERNAKKHQAKQIDQIAESIREFGFRQPLVLDKNNVVVIGHGRLEAAKQLKMKTVPCAYADDLTEDEIRKLRLADNKLNESEWDFDILAEELLDLDFGDLELDWGFAKETSPTPAGGENREINLGDYEDDKFECECPRCGFRFNP